MEQKKFIKIGLSMDNMRTYVGMIENEVSQFLRKDPSFRIFQMNDINEWGQFDVCSNLDATFAQLYTDLDGGFTPLNFMFPNLPLESYRKRDRAQRKMAEFYINIIKARKEGTSTVRWLSSSLLELP